MDRGMFSICSSTGCLPFFLFTVLVVCFEWKKYCQIHPADVLYFSRKKTLVLSSQTFKPSKNSRQFAVVCRCSFSSVISGILAVFQFHFTRAVMCHRTVNKELEVKSFFASD